MSILRCDGVQLVDVEFTELFDVDWSTCFVGLVVELGIVLVDFVVFWVVEAVAFGIGMRLVLAFRGVEVL